MPPSKYTTVTPAKTYEFVTIPKDELPAIRAGELAMSVIEAFKAADEDRDRAVIFFEGENQACASKRATVARIIAQKKYEKRYEVSNRHGRVYIWAL